MVILKIFFELEADKAKDVHILFAHCLSIRDSESINFPKKLNSLSKLRQCKRIYNQISKDFSQIINNFS